MHVWFAQPLLATSLQFPLYSEGILVFINSFLLSSPLIMVAASLTVAQETKDTPGTEPVQFRPKAFTGKLTPYDLEKVFQENKKKKEQGKALSYSSFIVKEFSDRYYPMAKFKWHRTSGSFRNVGIRKKANNTVQEVFLSWWSQSDSLQWGFFHGELERTTKANRFAVIADAEVGRKIKNSLLDRKLIGDPKDATDVFSYRTKSFTTESKTSSLKFPNKAFGETRYGVSVGEKVYFFTSKGEESK